MIAIQHRDGRTIELACPEEQAAELKPALASGWAIGKMVTAPTFVPIDLPTAPRKGPVVPSPATVHAVENLFLPGAKLTKRQARKALPAIDAAEVDAVIDAMAKRGAVTLSGYTYSAAAANP